MTENVHGTFISEKPSKIRWKPEEYSESQYFLTGSWDNEVNSIKLWSYKILAEYPEVTEIQKGTLPFLGDVTELKFVKNEIAIASSSDGYAILVSVENDHDGSPQLKEILRYKDLHKFSNGENSPCTALSTYDEDIVTVGEDGRINLLNARQNTPVHSKENADSCSLKCVCFLKHNEVLTGNLRGQMKIWDLRRICDEPVNTFMLSGEQIEATCLAYHPTQRHVVLAGSEDGSITVWDLRQNTYPVTLLSAHSEAVSEILFHPHLPDKLFSCSIGGELWHWNSSVKRITNKMLNLDIVEDNPWLSNDFGKDKLEVLSLMPKLLLPVNSLDVNSDKVLCGCDNEAIYVINNINL